MSFLRVDDRASTKKFHVKSNGPHEQIDVTQSLAGHISRQCLTVANRLHNPVPGDVRVSLQGSKERWRESTVRE